MRKAFLLLYISFLLPGALLAYNGVWQKLEGNILSAGARQLVPMAYSAYALNTNYLRNVLNSIPTDVQNARELELPMPGGGFRTFKVWQDPMMEDGLAVKYPGIKTFTGIAKDNPAVTAKLDFTNYGFHAMIFDGANTYMVDPYSNVNDGYYICYYKRNYPLVAGNAMSCLVSDETSELGRNAMNLTGTGLPNIKLKINGATKKTYRLALACTGEYAVAVDGPIPTKAGVLSKMVTSMNRVNGVYEREFAVHMNLVADEDTLIFLDGTTDPYSNGSGGTMLTQNQVTVTNRIGTLNYDIGHVFSTGGGGVANLSCVCGTSKAKGVTGRATPIGDPFDIDYVAHEMGHQFGGNHTFNNNANGSCVSNAVSTAAYEPGSGSTIMAYAGICTGDDLQPNSDPYFHAVSLNEITNFLAGTGGSCAVSVASGNNPPTIPPFSQIYNIPMKTPFELIAPEVLDTDHDTLTYCWEEWNRGDFGKTFTATRLKGPIFRSFNPTTSPTRVFPMIDTVLVGMTSSWGEKLPDTTRFLTFKLTVRDIFNGTGTFNFPVDTVHLNVTHTAGPFKVLTPATAVNWTGASTQIITWDVANTNVAPVSCDSVDIYLSIDGGYTYPYLVKAKTPNDGSETVVVPNVPTTNMARIKVKGSNNVFFNVNTTNFTVTHNTAGVAEIAWNQAVKVYPIPASNVLNVINSHPRPLQLTIVSAVGQRVWSSEVDKYLNIDISSWSRGMYYIQLTEILSGEKIMKPLVIQ
jgi:hypothetical protein